MVHPRSFAQLIDVEATRLGLEAWEVINLLEASIQRRYMRVGRTVHVSIGPDDAGIVTASALEALEGSFGLVWNEISAEEILRPNIDRFQQEIEQYVRQKESQRAWGLGAGTIIAAADDHYLVELTEASHPAEIGKIAVLPKKRAAKTEYEPKKGSGLWFAYKQKQTSQVDGAEEWTKIDCPLYASQTDSIFLRLIVSKYWHMDVACNILQQMGLIVIETDAQMGPILGPKGIYIEQLRKLTGLQRIKVAREPKRSSTPNGRLSFAIREIAPQVSAKVRPPKRGTEEWRVFVSDEQRAILIGVSGRNLRWIQLLSGVQFVVLTQEAA